MPGAVSLERRHRRDSNNDWVIWAVHTPITSDAAAACEAIDSAQLFPCIRLFDFNYRKS